MLWDLDLLFGLFGFRLGVRAIYFLLGVFINELESKLISKSLFILLIIIFLILFFLLIFNQLFVIFQAYVEIIGNKGGRERIFCVMFRLLLRVLLYEFEISFEGGVLSQLLDLRDDLSGKREPNKVCKLFSHEDPLVEP